MSTGKHQPQGALTTQKILLIAAAAVAVVAVAVVAVVAVVFATGGGRAKTPSEPSSTGAPSGPSEPAQSEATDPTQAPATQPTEPPTQPTEPPTEPTGPVSPAFVNPLTGLPCDTDLSGYKPYAVMLNNIRIATPQVGLSAADMIFEIPVEGNITRLMGLFQGFKGAEVLGSIRSSRPYFVDIAKGFDAIYIHAGGSDDAYNELDRTGITKIDAVTGSGTTFHRDQERRETMGVEHSLMLDTPKVEPYLADRGESLLHTEGYASAFSFAEAESRDGSPAVSVEARFNRSKSTFFEYDSATGLYKVSQFDKPMVDGATGEQLAVRNVVTLSLHITLIPGDTAGRLQATLTGSGSGWFICDGVIQRISWKRTSDTSQFILTYENGDELVLAPGTTYFAVLPLSGSVQLGGEQID